MNKEFQQIEWSEQLDADWRQLLTLAVAEDLGDVGDWTTASLVPEDAEGRAAVVARAQGVVAGLPAIPATLAEFESELIWEGLLEDGAIVQPGQGIGGIRGPARGLLVAERLVLNLLGRLSGIATLTQQYVEKVAGTKAKIYDTRKTTPGWRRLEKYAVRCGGGHNHRTGLFEAVLIKDNHLALGVGQTADASGFTPAEAVAFARDFISLHATMPSGDALTDDVMSGEIETPESMIVEIEVDTLDQLEHVLSAEPDIVLLDNMRPAMLRKAVALRDKLAPGVELEASGGVTLRTIRKIAETGVERISVGALTHSAVSLDFGLDWSV